MNRSQRIKTENNMPITQIYHNSEQLSMRDNESKTYPALVPSRYPTTQGSGQEGYKGIITAKKLQ